MKPFTLIENTKLDEHTYLVTIGTDIGQFTGAVVCRPEDYEYESEFFGYDLAELKAQIQYARAKRNQYDNQLRILSTFWRDMAQTRTYDANAFWVKKMRERVDTAAAKRHEWSERIQGLKQIYHDKIVGRDSFLKAYKDRHG